MEHLNHSKASALKHSPKTRRASASTPTPHALAVLKLEQDLMKIGYLDFASEAKMNRLIAGFLRTTPYRAQAKKFAEQAKGAALHAKVARRTMVIQ